MPGGQSVKIALHQECRPTIRGAAGNIQRYKNGNDSVMSRCVGRASSGVTAKSWRRALQQSKGLNVSELPAANAGHDDVTRKKIRAAVLSLQVGDGPYFGLGYGVVLPFAVSVCVG